ncbi:predicted protein [Postia placenta Mad-698-R]|nr:predicted protein [Postia placenta Mad-698-R]
MLAMGARPQVFSRLATYKVFEEDQTLLDVLCAFEHHDKFKAYKVRVEWILKEMTLHQPDEMRQRRRVVDTSMGDSIDPADAKKRAAKARQEAIMRQMKAQQASFVTNLEDLDADEDEDIGDTPEAPVSYGTCIVCQEELNNSKPFGSLGFLQPSRLLRRQPDSQGAYITEALSSPESLDRNSEQSSDTAFPPLEAMAKDQKARSFHNFDGFSAQYTRFGIHSSICSHMMHLECFTVYSGSIRQRHRAQATRNHPDNIHRKEFICPLCKSLGNVVLPVATTSMPTELNTLPFTDWTRAAGISILKSKADPVVDAMQLRNGSGEFVFWAAEDKYVPSYFRIPDRPADHMELHKMVDTVMVIGKNISQQSRHLRERPEPEPGERGAARNGLSWLHCR